MCFQSRTVQPKDPNAVSSQQEVDDIAKGKYSNKIIIFSFKKFNLILK